MPLIRGELAKIVPDPGGLGPQPSPGFCLDSTSDLRKFFLTNLKISSIDLLVPSHQRGDTRSPRSRGGMRWTRRSVRRALAVADGEAVWFWRPEAGVKFARTPTRRADDGVNKAVVPGESAKETVKPLRGGCRMIPVLPL